MNDYFFISSPLHLLMAANLSLQHPQHERIALIVSKQHDAGERFAAVAGQCPEIFDRVVDLSAAPLRRGGTSSSRFDILAAEFGRPMLARLFTGNDRRMEFQYAIHIASATNREIEGLYMDEGAVTYVGHKSMHRLAHRWIDPLVKKLFYGFWYKTAVTTGTSAWIQTAYVAFPDAVHPLLHRKTIVALDPAPFKTPPFKALAAAMLDGHPEYRDRLRTIKAVLTLPHEGCYVDRPEVYQVIGQQLQACFAAPDIAIKPHPRSTNSGLLQRLFPGALLLDRHIGMEALLPLLSEECIVAGDISSTLLTTRWLRPDLPVVALQTRDVPPARLSRLYAKLEIPMVAPNQLRQWLARRPHAEGSRPRKETP